MKNRFHMPALTEKNYLFVYYVLRWSFFNVSWRWIHSTSSICAGILSVCSLIYIYFGIYVKAKKNKIKKTILFEWSFCQINAPDANLLSASHVDNFLILWSFVWFLRWRWHQKTTICLLIFPLSSFEVRIVISPLDILLFLYAKSYWNACSYCILNSVRQALPTIRRPSFPFRKDKSTLCLCDCTCACAHLIYSRLHYRINQITMSPRALCPLCLCCQRGTISTYRILYYINIRDSTRNGVLNC